MKRLISGALLTVLVLCSCGVSPTDRGRAILDAIPIEDCRLVAEIKWDYGGAVHNFVVSYQKGTVTVLEPEALSGITASFDGEGVTLSMSGAEVFAGELLEITPAGAVPLYIATVSRGYLKSAEQSGDEVILTMDIPGGGELRGAFTLEDGMPTGAEVWEDGVMKIEMTFKEVEF